MASSHVQDIIDKIRGLNAKTDALEYQEEIGAKQATIIDY